jgi:hypothetical protein
MIFQDDHVNPVLSCNPVNNSAYWRIRSNFFTSAFFSGADVFATDLGLCSVELDLIRLGHERRRVTSHEQNESED